MSGTCNAPDRCEDGGLDPGACAVCEHAGMTLRMAYRIVRHHKEGLPPARPEWLFEAMRLILTSHVIGHSQSSPCECGAI